MQAVCHYTLLGVGTDASTEEINSAYAQALSRFKRRLAAGDPLPLEHLDSLRDAYRTLAAPASRASYDRERLAAMPPAPAAPAVAGEAGAPEGAVEFHGAGSEYLRIWLVNMALSVLTLGIYSAWAKVRREKYFHRNLVVDGAAFDYHGNPRAILVGRILLFILLMVMNFAEGISPAAHIAILAVAAFAVPWLLVRSLQFRARNTSYRGVRFAFAGSYREALALYLGHGALTLLTVGVYLPAFLRKQKAFLAGNLRFGDTPCRFDAGVGAFYSGLKVPLLLWVLMLAVPLLVAVIGAGGPLLAVLVPILMAALVLSFNLLLVPFIRVVGTNLLWNHTRLGDTAFRSTQTVGSYLGLVIRNWLLILLSLGFYWPIAQIRMASYRAHHLTVLNPAALGSAAAAQGTNPAAVGDEVIDAFDFDIAL
ncbi:MAG: DUF898 family protein [Rhodocyclales bacterium]|nr:DUF898 family protein [Rhodocyclales bacterium]